MTEPREMRKTSYNTSACRGGCGKQTNNRISMCVFCRTKKCIRCGTSFRMNMYEREICQGCLNIKGTLAHKFYSPQGDSV